MKEEVNEVEEDYLAYDYDDAKTQEEVETCKDWGCPYDEDSGVPFQLQQDMLEFDY